MAIDGEAVTPYQAISELNRRAGAQGVGRLDMVEDRLVGIKSREVYEAPGAIALITAHQELENVTVERDLARFKRGVDQRWGELVYDGLWFSPLKQALDAFIADAAAARLRRGPADPARRPRGGHRAALARPACTTSAWPPTTRATRSTSRWPGLRRAVGPAQPDGRRPGRPRLSAGGMTRGPVT